MPVVPVPNRPNERPPESPEDLYDGLSVTDTAIGALWRHQSHVLERYFDDHRESPDVALELPTGAGKTLVGLLIADWRRRVTGASSAFVCPTQQLAHQAHEKASGYGIPTVLLVGPNREWDPGDRTCGVTGDATIISVYSHIFNTSPKIKPQTLVLDDAHAAEGPVAKNWSVSVEREHLAYQALVDVVADAIPNERLSELHNDGLPLHSLPLPQLVGPKDLADRADAVVEALDDHLEPDESAGYALSEIRAHLPGCLMFVGWRDVLIRPFVPPTCFHDTFEDAEQRVYLSATLGQAGELERSFGRTKIPRVETPSDWERRGSGRRLVLLPRAGMQPLAASEFIEETIERFPRALVLVPSKWEAEEVEVLLPDGWEVLRIGDVDERLHPFQESTYRALVLANRYDGIDLPGEQCELIVMSGLPAGTHLQERFLFYTAGAESALRERIRTRLMQGMGRATRHRNDHAVVLMASEPLIDFLREPGNLVGLRPELQAELQYGLYLAREGHGLTSIVNSFLARNEAWEQAEQYLRHEADEANLAAPKGADQLQSAAASEVRACRAAWRGEPAEACRHAQAAVRQLTVGEVAPYRTFWKVLGAHWGAQHASATGDAIDARLASELSRDANASARAQSWRPILPEVPVDVDVEALETRALRLARELQAVSRSSRGERFSDELEKWMGTDSSSEFERGLERLGRMLGFDAVRPNVPTSPDSAWRDDDVHILWEAKSEEGEDGVVSASAARQATTHPTWVVRELDWDSSQEAIAVIVSPRTEIDDGARAVAAENVFLASSGSIRSLADEAIELWKDLLGAIHGLTPREAADRVAGELADRGLDTASLKSCLTATPVAAINGHTED